MVLKKNDALIQNEFKYKREPAPTGSPSLNKNLFINLFYKLQLLRLSKLSLFFVKFK